MRSAVRLRFSALFVVVVAMGVLAAAQAPQFSARTLGGSSISNSSFGNDVVLLQFWATWCGYCRKDQPAVDRIASEYSSNGVSVLAIDVGESESKVSAYLNGHPRSVPVALDESQSIAHSFGVNGFPYYVVLDRRGNVAARGGGAGGEAYLRSLLARGLGSRAKSEAPTQTASAAPVTRGSSPLMITVPAGQTITSAKPLPKTVFVLGNGEQFESAHYTINGGFLDVDVNGEKRRIPVSALDVKKTVSLNHQRGIEMKIPTSNSEVFLGF